MKRLLEVANSRSIAYRMVVPALAVALAFVVSGAIMLAIGTNPITAFAAMVDGAFGSPYALATTGVRMTPILLTGLAVAVSFRAGVFNVGAEGQLYAGAALATWVAAAGDGLPAILLIPLCMVGGFVGGALWIFVPAWLLAKRGVSEVVTTLMLNYVGIFFISYLVDPIYGPIGERGASYAQSNIIPTQSWLPIILKGTSLHAGLLFGIATAALLYVMFGYTRFGFKVRMLGRNAVAARFSGIDSARSIIFVMLLSGGIAGLAGAIEVMGLRHRLYDHFSPGYGYDGIAIALLANSAPLGVVVSAALFGALRAGANAMQQATGIETSVVLVVQALVILFMILRPFHGWMQSRVVKSEQAAAARKRVLNEP